MATTVLLLRRSRTDVQHVLVPSGKKHLAIHVTLGTADRAMLLYDTLIKALEARGFSVKVASGEHGPATTVTIGTERIGLFIDERIDRVERKPEPKARHPVYGRQYDYSPTGRLSIRLQLPYLGEARVRQNWWDASKQRVESCLNSVVVGLVTAAEAMKAQRIEQEARERERVAAEERRRTAEQHRQEEEARIRALGTSLKAWRRSEIVRQYAEAMRHAADAASLLGEGTPMAAWLRWVDAYADRLDPTLPAPTVPADPEPYRSPYAHYGAANAGNAADMGDLW